MSIPKRYAHAAFSNYQATSQEQRDVLAKIKRWGQHCIRDGGYGNLIFLGNPGTGKGHLACSILRLYARDLTNKRYSAQEHSRPVRCEYTTAAKLLREIQATFNGEGQTRAVFNRLTRADLLVIDEVGVGSNSDFAKDQLAEVIDERSAQLLPTIVISNLDESELTDYLDARAMDRLLEGFSYLLAFTWGSFRANGRQCAAKPDTKTTEPEKINTANVSRLRKAITDPKGDAA